MGRGSRWTFHTWTGFEGILHRCLIPQTLNNIFSIFLSGAYNIKTEMIPGLVGGFSEARPKSDIEWACYRAAQMPGPQDYDAKKGSHVFGGKLKQTFRLRRCFVIVVLGKYLVD